MGDLGDFWRDVKKARKQAGLPARRSAKPRAELVKFTAAHKGAGWTKHTDWHWQIKTARGTLDYWPSKGKFMIGGVVKVGPFSEIEAIIAGAAVPNRARKPAKKARKSTVIHDNKPLATVEGDWPEKCPRCEGGLFWRSRDVDPWVCDGCSRFKGRGLSISWLTTRAWSAMIEQLGKDAAAQA